MKSDPINQFNLWYNDAKNSLQDPSAMVLATATKLGIPSSRVVLLKHYDEEGFTFYTNLKSRKAEELKENPNAALLFHWKNKQVRIEGMVGQISDAIADKYFDSRPRDSRIVSILSKQSEILKDEANFQKKIISCQADKNFSLERPRNWSGFILRPKAIEFFISGEARNHKRYLYTIDTKEKWKISMLYP